MTTTTMAPLSILMCVKDGARDLPTALESLARQTVQSFEVVLVDDQSSDETREIAESHPGVSVVVDGPGLGLAMARNVGLQAARSRYVTFLDHDDLFHPTRVERILDRLGGGPEVPWFWTGFRTFAALEDSSTVDYEVPDSTWPDALVRPGKELDTLAVEHSVLDVSGSSSTVVHTHEDALNWGAAGAVLVARADWLREVGGFPTHVGPAEDILMLMNIARRAPILEIDQPTYFYRLRPDSETRQMRLPWAYLAALFSARFGGQHMPPDRALGRGAPLACDLVLEDMLARSIARDGFDGAMVPLYHMLCLLYPDSADRHAIFRRIATEIIRTRTPSLDRSLRRLRSVIRPAAAIGARAEGEIDT